MNKILFCLFIALALFSCKSGNRNPNLPEKQLLALMNDTTQKAPETPDVILPDTSYVPPMGAKFTEIRSVDLASPLITLKVAVPQGAKQTLKLSMYGRSVEYVTLQLPDEKDFFLSQTRVHYNGDGWAQNSGANTQVMMAGDYLITNDVLGIRLFDNKGVFVKNLLLSEFEGKRDVKQVEINMESLRQAVWRGSLGNRCFLAMHEYSSKKVFVGEYRVTNQTVDGPVMTQVRSYPSGMFLDHQTLFSLRGGTGNRPAAITFNLMGDTLCKFTNHVRLESGVRAFANSDRSFSYRSDGKTFFRQAYCDTIFRVQSANRIVPAYRFDFGALRVSAEEGVTAKTQGKLLPWKMIALKNSMILIFTEGRDCPNCRTAGEVKFHCLLFDSQTSRSTAIDMKSAYPEDTLIENDIDGGLPMPLNTVMVREDVMMATFTKGQIEEILKNNAKNMSAETVSKLKETSNNLKSNEMLVMKIRS